jgi:cytoskeletal protein CcmA (bactofilin family)
VSQSSVIGAGTSVRGSLEGEGSLEIFGHVDGDVTMNGDVSVGEGGSVLGNVTGTRLLVRGAVKGDLRAADAIVMERGARVVGDVSAPSIAIGAGALVRGNVRTESEPAAANVKPRPAAVAAAFKPPAFVAKPVAKAEPKLAPPARVEPPRAEPPRAEPPRFEAALDAPDSEKETPQPARAREPERRPPPPVLPSLGKGVKATKKKGRDD